VKRGWTTVSESRLLASLDLFRHAEAMVASANDPEPLPGAPFDDLDLDREEDRAEWRKRLKELADARLATARKRLQRLGIVDDKGELVSDETPPDMLPGSDTTLETG
jgi:hypothetical protein